MKRSMRSAFCALHSSARRLESRVIPDVLDRAAFLALAKTAGIPGGSVLLHHAEFGKQPEKPSASIRFAHGTVFFKFFMRTSFWSSQQVHFCLAARWRAFPRCVREQGDDRPFRQYAGSGRLVFRIR